MFVSSSAVVSRTLSRHLLLRGRSSSAAAYYFVSSSTTTSNSSGPITPSRRYFSPTTRCEKDEGGNEGEEGVFDKIACIGTGKMAEAILQPVIEQGVQPADKISVFDVSPDALDTVVEKYGVQSTSSIPELISDADLVLCCVKPQNLTPGFYDELCKGNPSEDSILLSIIAGKAIPVFKQGGFAKIVRSMPNTPAMIGEGMTVWSCTPNLSAEERKKIRSILSCCGKSMYVDDESYIDMATSISGSGPAYIFMLMESMIDAGVHMGFPREKAATLVYHTMLGSTLYAMESKEHPAILRNSVTSPSGTTASALYELENGRFRTVIKDAMWACYRRSLEMGEHDSNVGPGRRVTHPEPTKVIFAPTNGDRNPEKELEALHDVRST